MTHTDTLRTLIHDDELGDARFDVLNPNEPDTINQGNDGWLIIAPTDAALSLGVDEADDGTFGYSYAEYATLDDYLTRTPETVSGGTTPEAARIVIRDWYQRQRAQL